MKYTKSELNSYGISTTKVKRCMLYDVLTASDIIGQLQDIGVNNSIGMDDLYIEYDEDEGFIAYFDVPRSEEELADAVLAAKQQALAMEDMERREYKRLKKKFEGS